MGVLLGLSFQARVADGVSGLSVYRLRDVLVLALGYGVLEGVTPVVTPHITDLLNLLGLQVEPYRARKEKSAGSVP